MSTEEIRSKIAQLAERFLKRTAGELVTMRELLERARTGDTQALTEVRDLAHRMHGTGATLGFTEIGERAARIEALADAQSGDFEAMSACVARIDELIGAAGTPP